MFDKTYMTETAPPEEKAEVLDVLFRDIDALVARRNGHAERRIVTLRVRLDDLDMIPWLRAQSYEEKLYWSSREEEMEIAGVGVADLYAASSPAEFERMRADLAPALAASESDVRYFGGGRFDASMDASEAWAAFGAYRFVLPRFEVRQGATCELRCNLVLPDDYDQLPQIREQLAALSFEETGSVPCLPMPLVRTDCPSKTGWRENIVWALQAFEQQQLGKVVLARETRYQFDETLDALGLFEQLKAATPGCFHYFVQPQPGSAFLGATPERLFRREDAAVFSEAVAGTRPRGTSSQQDADLGQELLNSDKDRREHEFVRASIEAALAPLCNTLHIDAETAEMPLARARHLVSGIQGTLRRGVTSLDVLKALHPTPAVGGHPTKEAIAAIRTQEAFDRGWYAGPIGWIGYDAAEFAVGLRCGLVFGKRLSLFSGAGIVPGSVPDAEWREIEHKISDFTSVLGMETGEPTNQ